MGSGGTQPSHIERDFFASVDLPVDIRSVKTFIKPDDGVSDLQEMEVDLPIIYPHELWQYLINSGRLTVDANIVHAFWRHFREEVRAPWAMAHPAQSDHIPIGLYGDDVVYTKTNEKLIGLLLDCPLVRFVNSWLCRFPFFVLLRCNKSLGHRNEPRDFQINIMTDPKP